MLFQRKSKHAKPAGGLIPGRNLGVKEAVALSVAAAFVVVVALGSSARNTLLQESAVKRASDRFEQQMHNSYAEPESVRLAHEAAASIPEPMPAKAKPAKNRDEAMGVLRPLVSSNSDMTYDSFGRIVEIVDPGPVTRQFVYSGDRLCEERDGSGAVTKQFFDWGEVINGMKYFYTRNHEGSITEMTDSSGNIVAQYQYDPFGSVTRIAGAGPDSDFLYAGYLYHLPSGLYITAHRLYNPKLGRWLNRDPNDDLTFDKMPQSPDSSGPNSIMPVNPVASAFAPMMQNARDPMLHAQLARLIPQVPGTRMPSGNAYEYANNNPVNFTDPSGLSVCPLSPDFCRRYCTYKCRGSTDPWCYEKCYAACTAI